MGIFFQFFSRKSAIFKFFTNSKGSDLNKKMRVVAGTQGDAPLIFLVIRQQEFLGCRHESRGQPSTFSCHIPSGDKKQFRVVAMSHGDNTQLFCVAFFWQQEKS